MSVIDRVRTHVEQLIDAAPEGLEGIDLYDVEFNASVLRITLSRAAGLDLDALAAANRVISSSLDDADPIPGSYTLEVSSPGVERRLRTIEHWAGAVDEVVSVKLGPWVDGERRYQGTLRSIDGTSVVVDTPDSDEPVTLDISDVEKARTVFEWTKGDTRSAKGSRDAGKVDTR